MPKKNSRRLQELRKKLEDRPYEPTEALQLLKETATAKFPEAAKVNVIRTDRVTKYRIKILFTLLQLYRKAE